MDPVDNMLKKDLSEFEAALREEALAAQELEEAEKRETAATEKVTKMRARILSYGVALKVTTDTVAAEVMNSRTPRRVALSREVVTGANGASKPSKKQAGVPTRESLELALADQDARVRESMIKLVLMMRRKGRAITRLDVGKALGIHENSCSPKLAKAIELKLIKRVDHGTYELT